jgi:hypothetical protein
MSSPQRLHDPWAPEDPRAPRVEIVAPGRNEEHDLAEGIRRQVQPGRGRALRDQWPASHAEVVASMDVDLSTDLSALLPQARPASSAPAEITPAQAALIHPEGTEQ